MAQHRKLTDCRLHGAVDGTSTIKQRTTNYKRSEDDGTKETNANHLKTLLCPWINKNVTIK